jgi:peptidoglycan hydrolase-like protein with peptidoglycan-binding domain
VRWQKALNRSRRGGRVVADGDFGPATHAATVSFQKSVGLGPAGLGIVGPNTRAAMKRVLR